MANMTPKQAPMFRMIPISPSSIIVAINLILIPSVTLEHQPSDTPRVKPPSETEISGIYYYQHKRERNMHLQKPRMEFLICNPKNGSREFADRVDRRKTA
ncbi:hypothetical protein V1478_001822 [Vespula squamosa]|uniref:Uncharacterized protein n=1 Tax=Vespula squamosa TaxID=30214 RepID=A0ABD2BY75_VESSQ